jgi:RNA polymerase sigma-70 factor (ECF subfamily)
MDDGTTRRTSVDSDSNAEKAAVESLLVRAADGDQQAWRDLIGLYSRRVFAMAKSHLRSDELAEEITQSVFVTIAQKLPGSETGGYREQGSFEPWLFRITMNRVRDEARRAKRQARPTDPETISKAMPASEQPPATVESDPHHRKLREALDRLDAPDREIIDMRHIGGMSFKQIAAVLDAPIGTVLARHHRALKKLRNTLES